MTNKLHIDGDFSNQDIENNLGYTCVRQFPSVTLDTTPKHLIPPHPGFDLVELPNGSMAKLAYNQLYTQDTEDLEIELEHISKFEKELPLRQGGAKASKKAIKFHYKKAVSIISPDIAAGWNRWSENILELFIDNKTHKIVWGSGNCGKSVIFAMLLYIKWRVRPNKRMVVIASKIVKDASARVFGYIKKIHLEAPKSKVYRFNLKDGQNNRGIYVSIYDETKNRWVDDDRACIVNLPVKVDAKNNEVGSNLLGKHPDDRLILAFDEAQELLGKLLSDRIFLNWYTNPRLDVYAWGNPMPVDWYNPEEWDMLFKLGAGKLSLQSLRKKEKEASMTTSWSWSDTTVLHISMMDSPKDDEDERFYSVELPDGTRDSRLHFLAGKDSVSRIAEKTSPHSPSWYSQVLGFPFIDSAGNTTPGVLTPLIVKESKKYPLMWKTPLSQLQYFMGVDPSISDRGDDCCIVVGRMGLMMDNRMGVDLMNGKYCKTVKQVEGEEFIDTTIKLMHRLSIECNIPLKNIAVETHGVGEVLRYALQTHIESGMWSKYRGQSYHIVSPTVDVTTRPLFKTLGRMLPAKDVVMDCMTEYWVAVRCAFLTRQIFNVPEQIIGQFYNRQLKKNGAGTKYRLESKEDMKKRGIRSPGAADALCIMFEHTRNVGFSYKFYNKGSYTPYFGAQYEYKQEQKRIKHRLGLASRILQLDENMGNATYGTHKKRSPRNGLFNVDAV